MTTSAANSLRAVTDRDDHAIVTFNDITVFKPRDLSRLRGRERSLQAAAGAAAEEVDIAGVGTVLVAIPNRSIHPAEGDAALPHPTDSMIGAAGTHVLVSTSVVNSHGLQLPEDGESACEEALPISRGVDVATIHP